MARMSVFLLLASALVFNGCQAQTSDAIESYVYGILTSALSSGISIPDQSQSFSIKLGFLGKATADVSLSNIAVASVSIPRDQFALGSGSTGVAVSAASVSVDVSTNFAFVWNLFGTLNLDGTLNAVASGISITLDVDLNLATDPTNPGVTVNSCSSTLGSLNLNFSGTTSDWFFDYFKTQVSTMVTSLLPQYICPGLTSYVNSGLNLSG